MSQKEDVKEKEEIQISKSTLSIADEKTPIPESWEDLQKEEVLFEEKLSNDSETTAEEFHAEPAGFSAAGFDVALKAWELIKDTSGVSAEPKSTHVLPLKDPDGLNYMGETFRSPVKGNYRKLFWTVSLYPCGYFEFYFNITSKARPKNPEIADGYYIPNITVIPAKAWAYPLCSLNVKIHCSNPVRSETPKGLVVANMDMIVSMSLIKLGIIPWRSKMQFTVSGDKTELTRT